MTTETLAPLELPLDGVRGIEASAGTGKTWTIAALYVRAVLGHRHQKPLLPPNILVVTFTDAATQELRDRIRTRLVEAAQCFRDGAAADSFLMGLREDYTADERQGCAYRLEHAAQWMDEAAVFTIHAWSQRMLTQHAFDSGHPFTQTLEPDLQPLLMECVRDYWRYRFYALDAATVAGVLGLWSTPDDLYGALRPLLDSTETKVLFGGAELTPPADVVALLEGHAHARAHAEVVQNRARGLWLQHLAAVEGILRNASIDGTLHRGRHPARNIEGNLATMRRWMDGSDEDGVKVFASGALAKCTTGNGVPPKHPAFDAIDEWISAQRSDELLRGPLLADASAWVRRRFMVEKQRLGVLGYDDLLCRLDAALCGNGGARLATTIREQYPLAMIDEFQDTDPTQYRIFSKVYVEPGGGVPTTGLLLIGDPKQAIYGFRGADIHTYLLARGDVAEPKYTLGTNHRSTEALVRAVNGVFEQAGRHGEGAFMCGSEDEGPAFAPVFAKGRDDVLKVDGRPVDPLVLWRDNAAPVLRMGKYRGLMAGACAAEIVKLLSQGSRGTAFFESKSGQMKPVRAGDVAVLVRTRVEAAAIAEQLSQRGVRSVYLSLSDSVYNATAARDVLLWLRACARPESDRALRAALATPTLDTPYSDLERLQSDERHWEKHVAQFVEYRDVWRRRGVLPMLHQLMHEFDLPARLLARADGERTLTNVLHLAELLQQASAHLDGEASLLRHLAAERVAGRTDGTDTHVVRLESDANRVQIVTIHKSKGLEYPIVYVPFACSFRLASEPYRFHQGGRYCIELQKDQGEAKALAERERQQEDIRLLYVALTRARHAVCAGVAAVASGSSKKSQIHLSGFGYLLSGGRDLADLPKALSELHAKTPEIMVTDVPQADRDCFTDGHATTVPEQARAYSTVPFEAWTVDSFSSLKFDHPLPAVQTEGVDSTDPPTSTGLLSELPAGRDFGTFLHDLLEWVAKQGFAAIAKSPASLRDTVARRCHRRRIEAHIGTLVAWILDFLRMPLALPGGETVTLASLDASQYSAEMDFWFDAASTETTLLDALVTRNTVGGAARPPLIHRALHGHMNGKIDLLFEHRGRYYVVDYKSNSLHGAGAYEAASLTASILESRYDLQYSLYVLALHRQLRARLAAYDYDRHVGGVAYLYVRGIDGTGRGIHCERPTRSFIEHLDALFDGAELPS